MRKRHSTGGVRKQRGTWVGIWWIDGVKKSQVVGLVKVMSKTEAREAVAKIVAAKRAEQEAEGDKVYRFSEFVEQVYFAYYKRKWKHSTRDSTVNRIRVHLSSFFETRELKSLKRDELQDLLDSKAASLSFSTVDHLRWDLKAIFDMAISEGQVVRNPALLLFTPREAKTPVRRVMTIEEVQKCFSVLDERERLIAKFAVLGGMRPGEIFALTWERLTPTYADIHQRIYRGVIDTPKTEQSVRRAALSEGLLADIQSWRDKALTTEAKAWVFPSERMTPLSKDNCWRRSMQPKLKAVKLAWCNFQVMRRSHATLMNQTGADPKLAADQLGHSVDVNQNIYTQSPVESRLGMVNKLEQSLLVM